MLAGASAPDPRLRSPFLSPLLRRILLVNALPLALLVATLLYLDQYQDGLLVAEVSALREQASIYANAIGESAVRVPEARHADPHPEPVLEADVARRLLRRLTEPTPLAVARLYGPGGTVIADSNPGGPGAHAPHLPTRPPPRNLFDAVLRLYDRVLSTVAAVIDLGSPARITEEGSGEGLQWSPGLGAPSLGAPVGGSPGVAAPGTRSIGPRSTGPGLTGPRLTGAGSTGSGSARVGSARMAPAGLGPAGPAAPVSGLGAGPPGGSETLRVRALSEGPDMPPYIRRTRDDRLLVTVAEPVRHDGHTVGIILLTRAAGEVDRSLDAVRRSILDLFLLAFALTVLLSVYLARTIARPILSLARAAHSMREGAGRTGSVPEPLRARGDEIGVLGRALAESARALWARMDATERFAADVSHEIKNPLTSIASALETLPRIADPDQQRRLLGIIGDDVARLDRLISDIARASRVDAELSRTPSETVALGPLLEALATIHEAGREAGRGPEQPRLVVHEEQPALAVLAVEDRLVQVLRNLIGNAVSFSPRGGTITLRAAARGTMVELSVEDQGPGVPDARLEHIFERFYSERPAGERFGAHSGLGLSISRQIVEALKGRIRAENVVDARGRRLGARFVVTLPRAVP